MFCKKCGAAIEDNSNFCPKCGTNLRQPLKENVNTNHEDVKESIKHKVNDFTSKINTMAGESGPVTINLSDLYSEVTKKHTAKEQEQLLIGGIKSEQMTEKEMVTSWPKPWLYSRVFAGLFACFLGLLFVLHTFGNFYVLPAIMFVGALVVPFSLVTFFWETNIPRNISIFFVTVMFLVGGVASFIPTMFGYSLLGSMDLTLMGAIGIGIVEEVGKAIIVIYIIDNKKYKYILNGILVGSCIGAGFAVFETAGYALGFFFHNPVSFEHLIYLRSVTTLGTHIMWSAMVGAGYIAAGKDYKNINFLNFLGIAIFLHALWDWQSLPLPNYIKFVILIIVAWGIVLTLVSSGLKQIERLSNSFGGEENV